MFTLKKHFNLNIRNLNFTALKRTVIPFHEKHTKNIYYIDLYSTQGRKTKGYWLFFNLTGRINRTYTKPRKNAKAIGAFKHCMYIY